MREIVQILKAALGQLGGNSPAMNSLTGNHLYVINIATSLLLVIIPRIGLVMKFMAL